MICHFCHQTMKPRSYDNWEMGGRREITYECTKTTCGSRDIRWHNSGYGELPFWISMVIPDEEITNYSIPFDYKNKNYILVGFYPNKSDTGGLSLCESVSQEPTVKVYTPPPFNGSYIPYFKRKNIIVLDRFYPIIPYHNFFKQAVAIYEKIQPLILFS